MTSPDQTDKPESHKKRYVDNFLTSWKYDLPQEGLVLESWSQGLLVGGMLFMVLITLANMKRRLLHKLIVLELLLTIPHGTFCFMDFPGYGWYVSGTAVTLYASWCLHNIIGWMKTKPFLSPMQSSIYLWSFLCVTPYWFLECIANFLFNNNVNSKLFNTTRILECFFRDPWWVFTCINLIFNIKKRYNFQLRPLIYNCPHIGMLIISMIISIIFSFIDLLSATVKFGAVKGINPYWKLSLVFKCFCDSIVLDEFKSALDRVRAQNLVDGAAHQQRLRSTTTDFQPLREKPSISSTAETARTDDTAGVGISAPASTWHGITVERSFDWVELRGADEQNPSRGTQLTALPAESAEPDGKRLLSKSWKRFVEWV